MQYDGMDRSGLRSGPVPENYYQPQKNSAPKDGALL